jgi:hypothetical protein
MERFVTPPTVGLRAHSKSTGCLGDLSPRTGRVPDTFLSVDLRDRASIDAAVAEIEGPVYATFSVAGLPGPPFSDLETMIVNFIGARHDAGVRGSERH